jgi:hypothetical protein
LAHILIMAKTRKDKQPPGDDRRIGQP